MKLEQVYDNLLISVDYSYGYKYFAVYMMENKDKYKLIYSDLISENIPFNFVAMRYRLNSIGLGLTQKEDIANIILYLYEKIINNSMLE